MPRQSTNLKLALSIEISSGDVFKNTHDFHTALLQWSKRITAYERFGTLFDDTIKRAVLLANAPLEVATHLRVTHGATDNYERMKIAIELYFKAIGRWNAGDEASPMDIGAFGDKGKKGGRGKGDALSSSNASAAPARSTKAMSVNIGRALAVFANVRGTLRLPAKAKVGYR